jgi:taurine transport system permease protein
VKTKKLHYTVFPKIAPKRILTISTISVICFIILWFVLTKTGLIPKVILPGPDLVLKKSWDIIQNGFSNKSLFEHISVSILRVFGSIAIATVLAVPLGILVSINDYFRAIIDPFVEFYRPLPPLTYLPLIIIWFGVGELSKIILIFLAIFAPIFLNTRAGVNNIPKERINAAMSLGASRWQLIRYIIFPSSLHSILTGIRIGIGFGWTTLVAAEMVAATSGLGHMILSASEFLQTEVVIIGIIIIGLIAFMTDLVMRKMIQRLIHWSGR